MVTLDLCHGFDAFLGKMIDVFIKVTPVGQKRILG
jgi:hypothetical protein